MFVCVWQLRKHTTRMYKLNYISLLGVCTNKRVRQSVYSRLKFIRLFTLIGTPVYFMCNSISIYKRFKSEHLENVLYYISAIICLQYFLFYYYTVVIFIYITIDILWLSFTNKKIFVSLVVINNNWFISVSLMSFIKENIIDDVLYTVNMCWIDTFT